MSDNDFDPASELHQIRERKKMRRKRNYWRGRSQLDAFAAELLALYDSGATPADLKEWLSSPPRRLRVHHSTVARWLKRTLERRQSDRRGQ
ncbi:hypothetical protein [Halomonas sp. AOP42-D1-22]|uniref:hypothetical protein n=1 Tax=Halomonas sp. AOP42-D1-22 TaxID=3457667 RepID=UPI0040333D8A